MIIKMIRQLRVEKKRFPDFFILAFYLIVVSCNMKSQNTILPGKIAVRGIMSDECKIYVDSNNASITFNLRNDKEGQYNGFTWLNSEDYFLGSETILGISREDYKTNIAKFDLSGKLIGRIYEAEKGELAWSAYTSRDDKYLLFTTHRLADPELYPFESLTPMLSLNVLDLNLRKIVKSIDSIGRSPNFELKESPWLVDGNHFVYSISSETKLMSEGKATNPLGKGLEGVYVYNVQTHENKLLVSGGSFAIACPVSNRIAYINARSINVMNLNDNSEKSVYEISSKEKIRNIHWTPDGKYIYVAFTRYWGISDWFHTGEKLIEVNTGKEIPFTSIKHGFQTYTWK
jgi:hypothetical protein